MENYDLYPLIKDRNFNDLINKIEETHKSFFDVNGTIFTKFIIRSFRNGETVSQIEDMPIQIWEKIKEAFIIAYS